MNAESRFTEITQNTADLYNWSEVMCLWALQMLASLCAIAVTTGLQMKQWKVSACAPTVQVVHSSSVETNLCEMVWPAQQTIGYYSQALNLLRLSEGIFSNQGPKFLHKQ